MIFINNKNINPSTLHTVVSISSVVIAFRLENVVQVNPSFVFYRTAFWGSKCSVHFSEHRDDCESLHVHTCQPEHSARLRNGCRSWDSCARLYRRQCDRIASDWIDNSSLPQFYHQSIRKHAVDCSQQCWNYVIFAPNHKLCQSGSSSVEHWRHYKHSS